MPGTLRARAALFLMLAAFLIPLSVSGLRGLTHVITCDAEVETPFTMVIKEGEPPQLLSSTRVERGQQQGVLCETLRLLIKARAGEGGRDVDLEVSLTNISDTDWRGTVQLAVTGKTRAAFPVNIGSVPAGQTRSDVVEIELPPGSSEVGGQLLIGP